MANKPYQDEEWLRDKWFSGQGHAEIAHEAGCSQSTLTKWARKFDLPHFSDARPWNNESKLREMYHGEQMTYQEIADHFGISKAYVGELMQGYGIEPRGSSERHLVQDRHPQYYTHPRGHVIVASEHKGEESKCMMHTLVAIADGADPHELFGDNHKIVHHKNGVRWDNRPENLQVMTDSEHTKHHWENGDIPPRGEWYESEGA